MSWVNELIDLYEISKKCNACSLKDICIPALNKKKSVSRYIDSIIAVEEKE